MLLLGLVAEPVIDGAGVHDCVGVGVGEGVGSAPRVRVTWLPASSACTWAMVRSDVNLAPREKVTVSLEESSGTYVAPGT